jgi:hypothetical protein
VRQERGGDDRSALAILEARRRAVVEPERVVVEMPGERGVGLRPVVAGDGRDAVRALEGLEVADGERAEEPRA